MTPSGAIQWRAGDARLRGPIERAIAAGLPPTTRLQQSPRRTVHHLALRSAEVDAPPDADVIVKIHHTATGDHPLRERWKQRFGRSPARREWKALETLFAAGVPVPRPLAWGRLANHDEFIVAEHLEGRSLAGPEGAPTDAAGRALLDSLAHAIGSLHTAGYRHGDLHLGNCRVTPSGIALLDVQRAARLRHPDDRLLDLARLELSMARAGWSPRMRMGLRDRLSAGPEFDPVLRRFLRDHLRGRSRRVLRIGRNWSTAAAGGAQGLRDRGFEPSTLETVFAACTADAAIAQRRDGRVRLFEVEVGERAFVVKHTIAGGRLRALADVLRGTPAARAFRLGQAHALLADRVARPLAFLEQPSTGLPTQSWLFLEKVGDEDLDRVLPDSADAEGRIARALGSWLAEGHAWGLMHRDLKASNLRVTIRPGSIRFWLVDLEDLTGPSEPSDESRWHALAQLNASLADEAFGLEARRAGFERYLERLPFSDDPNRVMGEIARRSLARAHRWRGEGCAERER